MNLGMQYNLRNGVFHANVTEFVVLRHLEFPLLVFLPATSFRWSGTMRLR